MVEVVKAEEHWVEKIGVMTFAKVVAAIPVAMKMSMNEDQMLCRLCDPWQLAV